MRTVLVLFVLLLAAPRAETTTLDVYTQSGCPRCEDARVFLQQLGAEQPGLLVREHDVVTDERARRALRDIAARRGVATPGVPAFVVGDDIIVGFDPASTPQRVRAMVLGAEQHAHDPAPADACGLEEDARCEPVAPRRIDVPILGAIDVDAVGLPLFTLAVGLVDGFNPCATWVLLFLLAMLVNVKDRKRMALIAGTFVVVSGLVYYAFMAAWLTFFMVVGLSTAVRLVIAAVAVVVGVINIKDFVAAGRGPTLGIPPSAKPGIYARVRAIVKAENIAAALVAVVVLAFLVNLVELLCTAGLPAVYTAILTSHALPTWEYHAYLALYIFAYMLDDAILATIGVVTLGKRKLQERAGRWLKLLSGVVILVLGVLLVLQPRWLGF